MSNELKGGDNAQTLSTDIHVITAEINAYQRVAGEAIFEIGRRLKWVRDSKTDGIDSEEIKIAKERELAGGWIKWLAENTNMSRGQASKFITVFEELTNGSTSNQIGLEALYQIATMPEESRDQAFNEDGTAKTVRELREVKAELKKTENQRDAEQKERERLEIENEELAGREPEVIVKVDKQTETVTIDNTPGDYEAIKEELAQKQREIDELTDRLADIPETKELRDRSFDTPHGVKLLDDFYNAMDELSEWQRKYAWITSDIEQLKSFVKVDEDMQEEFRKNMNMWRTLGEIFHEIDDNIIDAEIININ